MRLIPAVVTLAFFLVALSALAAKDFDHSALDAILKGAVKGRLVDYDAVEKQREQLRKYLKAVAEADAKKLPSKAARLAFYTNAYNAIVLEEVLASGRPESVLKVPGFFDKKKHKVAGEMLTLNELEEKKLRSLGDPRVHFVVNCASYDCPPLWERAYTEANWEKALEDRTVAFLRRKGEVVVDDEKKTVTIIKLFEWYAGDWGGEEKIRTFLAKYLPDVAKKVQDPAYKLQTREYDWRLNAAK